MRIIIKYFNCRRNRLCKDNVIYDLTIYYLRFFPRSGDFFWFNRLNRLNRQFVLPIEGELEGLFISPLAEVLHAHVEFVEGVGTVGTEFLGRGICGVG